MFALELNWKKNVKLDVGLNYKYANVLIIEIVFYDVTRKK